MSLNHISTYAAVYETNTKTEFNNTGKKHCKFNNGGIEESYKPALKNLVQKKKTHSYQCSHLLVVLVPNNDNIVVIIGYFLQRK